MLERIYLLVPYIQSPWYIYGQFKLTFLPVIQDLVIVLTIHTQKPIFYLSASKNILFSAFPAQNWNKFYWIFMYQYHWDLDLMFQFYIIKICGIPQNFYLKTYYTFIFIIYYWNVKSVIVGCRFLISINNLGVWNSHIIMKQSILCPSYTSWKFG